MKFRGSHITNSSSSNFVVTVKHFPVLGLEDQYPFIGKVIGDIKKFLTTNSYVKRIETIRQLNDYYLNILGTNNENLTEDLKNEELLDEYNEHVKLLNEDRLMLFLFSLSDQDEGDAEMGALFGLVEGETWIDVDGTFGDY